MLITYSGILNLHKFNLTKYIKNDILISTSEGKHNKPEGEFSMLKRIRKYLWCKRMGINHPWKASGDKRFMGGNW